MRIGRVNIPHQLIADFISPLSHFSSLLLILKKYNLVRSLCYNKIMYGVTHCGTKAKGERNS